MHPELNLRTYLEEDVAWTTSEIETVSKSGQPEFVRRACLSYNGPEKDLNSVLALADLVLGNVCEKMGAGKIGYTWGLAPISQSNRERLGVIYHNDHELLPAGYGLVACVENVEDALRITPGSGWYERKKLRILAQLVLELPTIVPS